MRQIRIQIILRMRNRSFGPWPSLSVYARKHVSAWGCLFYNTIYYALLNTDFLNSNVYDFRIDFRGSFLNITAMKKCLTLISLNRLKTVNVSGWPE